MARAAVACPVCGKGHRNAQGLGGHLAHSKDQDHAAYRATGILPAAPAPGASAASSAHGGQAGGSASPVPARPPPEPFTPEWSAWMAEQFNLNFAKWLQQREERRAERAIAAQTQAQGAPRAAAAPQAARAPEPALERLEDFGDAYWRRLLGSGYRPRREEQSGP